MRSVFAFFFLIVLTFSLTVIAYAKPDKYLTALNTEIGYREASSYADYIEKRDIEVGIERIDKDDMKRLLGNDIKTYRPFDVAITNNSKFRIYINQTTVLYTGTQQAFAKFDLSDVIEKMDPGGRGNKDDMRDAYLRMNVMSKALPHTVVNPGETIQGIIFVKDKDLNAGAEFFIQIQNLKRVAFLSYTLPLK